MEPQKWPPTGDHERNTFSNGADLVEGRRDRCGISDDVPEPLDQTSPEARSCPNHQDEQTIVIV